MAERARRKAWYGAVAALVLSASGAWAWAWWRGRPERHLAEARRQLDIGRPASAAEWLALPEATPATRDRALLLRARSALDRGRPADAVRPLERVDPAGPWAADAAFWKGRTLYAARQSHRAIPWFQKALEIRPDDPEALRWLAAAAYDLGLRDAALAALGRVTQLEPRDPRAWRTLGLILKEYGHHDRARAAYEASLRIDPDQPRVRLELAQSLEALGRHGDAERQLDACRGRVPEADRLELLVRCLRARNDRPALEAALARGLAESPGHPGLNAERAVEDLVEGRPAEAVGRLDRALAADPYNPQWHHRRGLALRRLGRGDEAERERARAEELNRMLAELSALDAEADDKPDDPEIRCRLGRLCLDLGKVELAASWFRAALACDPKNADAREALAGLRR